MSKTHWKKLTNPDYLGAYALIPGQDLIATIKNVKREIVTGPEGKKEECSVCYFAEGGIKPMVLNATNSKSIAKLTGSPYIEDWAGRRIQIYVDNHIRFGRDFVEGLRIRPFPPKEIKPAEDGKYICEECKSTIEAYGNMNPAQVAQYTYQKYGRSLCSNCAQNATEPGKPVDVLAGKKGETTNENNEN